MCFEILGLGAIVFPLILAWSWSEDVSVATYVLALLAFSAAIVALLIGVYSQHYPFSISDTERPSAMRCGAAVSFPKRSMRTRLSCAGCRPNLSRIVTHALFPGGNGDG